MNRSLMKSALSALNNNTEQLEAIHTKENCVVLAGPGSGKTKTLTLAMARALIEDVEDPLGIACITYNNECASELKTRLFHLGIESSERVFIGTVHSFALTQILYPYARCVLEELPPDFRLSTSAEIDDAIFESYKLVINEGEDPQKRWKFAAEKRRCQVDRTEPAWLGRNPDLARFVEQYEALLHQRGLIDYDDMPLLAFRIVRDHEWIRKSLEAKFPILFVDEYQDLGCALHELVKLLCFNANIRLFAVGDPDQSIYRFLGARPSLLNSLTEKDDVKKIELKFNYRCGKSIIDASIAVLGENRSYRGPSDEHKGSIELHPIRGDLNAQARDVFHSILPRIQGDGISLDEVALLYRNVNQGDKLADAARFCSIPMVRADKNALIKRNSPISRFIESCAAWASGGWKDGSPLFSRLVTEATSIVAGPGSFESERQRIQDELAEFIHPLDGMVSAHEWVKSFQKTVLGKWYERARWSIDDWETIDQIVKNTDPANRDDADIPLAHLGGRTGGSGRLNLSTLHSAKGREFDAVILFGMNADILPNKHDRKVSDDLREARRLFYVGITRARKVVYLAFEDGNHSEFVAEVRRRLQQ